MMRSTIAFAFTALATSAGAADIYYVRPLPPGPVFSWTSWRTVDFRFAPMSGQTDERTNGVITIEIGWLTSQIVILQGIGAARILYANLALSLASALSTVPS